MEGATWAERSWARANDWRTIELATGVNERAGGIYLAHGLEMVGFHETTSDIIMRWSGDSPTGWSAYGNCLTKLHRSASAILRLDLMAASDPSQCVVPSVQRFVGVVC